MPANILRKKSRFKNYKNIGERGWAAPRAVFRIKGSPLWNKGGPINRRDIIRGRQRGAIADRVIRRTVGKKRGGRKTPPESGRVPGYSTRPHPHCTQSLASALLLANSLMPSATRYTRRHPALGTSSSETGAARYFGPRDLGVVTRAALPASK